MVKCGSHLADEESFGKGPAGEVESAADDGVLSGEMLADRECSRHRSFATEIRGTTTGRVLWPTSPEAAAAVSIASYIAATHTRRNRHVSPSATSRTAASHGR